MGRLCPVLREGGSLWIKGLSRGLSFDPEVGASGSKECHGVTLIFLILIFKKSHLFESKREYMSGGEWQREREKQAPW